MKNLSLALLMLLSASMLINCEVKLPQFVGIGYNIFTGNPKTDRIDPGFKSQIFRLSYAKKEKTNDNHFLVPDNMETSNVQACSYSSKVSQYTGTQSYQKDLRTFVELGIGFDAVVKSASFSASSEFSSVKKSIKDDESVITESYSACELYMVQIPRFLALDLSRNFKNAIKMVAENKKNPADIIDSFGTHYISKVVYGGRAHIQYKMSREKVQELESMGIDIKTAAQASYGRVNGNAKFNLAINDTKINIFEKKTQETKHIFIGGKPPKNGSIEDWQQEIRSQIHPIRYEIKSFDELLNVKYFPDLSEEKLNEIKQQLNDKIKQLANDHKPAWDNGEDENLPGRPELRIKKTELFGTYTSQGRLFEDQVNENIGSTVRRVLLRSAACLDRIQFLMSDSLSSNYTVARGSFGGSEAEWPVPDDEYISQIELRHDDYVRGITFITNKGKKSPHFGSTKGHYSMIKLDGRLVGVYGRADPKYYIYQIGFITAEVVKNGKKRC